MKRILLCLILVFTARTASATGVPAASPGAQGFAEVRQCIMQNDARYCRSILTQNSLPYFNRFLSYKLMPCLPTDFSYDSEETVNGLLVVKAISPGRGGNGYMIHLVFENGGYSPKLDLPATFRRGFGDNWQDKVNMSEQLYLMMKQNMGDKLGCDQLNGLMKSN